MATIAILGYGTVGSGVLEVLRRNAASIERRAGQPVTVKYICDIRDFSSHPDAALFVNNIDVILSDPEVTAVVETIGGLKPAYFYVKSALESGRHVVTSNKELVATHGAELLAIARRRGVCFLFEASVGGGTPIITPMHQCMAANVISEIAGIVNGTTNFMLTKMARENMDFGAALKLAQSLGYAETIDPSADVDGIDAQRKISILASLAFGRHFFPQNVPTRGIRDVSVKDIALAARQGAAVRLIAWARRGDDGSVALAVEPMLIPRENQLAGVEDVFNAVLVKGDMLGDVVFYGKGAGKLPTASAVVADVIDTRQPVLAGIRAHRGPLRRQHAGGPLRPAGKRDRGGGKGPVRPADRNAGYLGRRGRVYAARRDKRASCGAVRQGAGRRRARGQHAQVDGGIGGAVW